MNKDLLIISSCLETVAKTGMILLAGEVTSRAFVDYQKVVRDTIKHIGYDDSSKGIRDFGLQAHDKGQKSFQST